METPATDYAWSRIMSVLDSPVLFLLAMDAYAEAAIARNERITPESRATLVRVFQKAPK